MIDGRDHIYYVYVSCLIITAMQGIIRTCNSKPPLLTKMPQQKKLLLTQPLPFKTSKTINRATILITVERHDINKQSHYQKRIEKKLEMS